MFDGAKFYAGFCMIAGLACLACWLMVGWRVGVPVTFAVFVAGYYVLIFANRLEARDLIDQTKPPKPSRKKRK